jgi:hypothetical protein
MKTDKLLSLLGRSAKDYELIPFCAENNLDISKVELEPEFYRGYLEKKQEGFSLVFTDEREFLNKPEQALRKGELYFSGVFFYADGKEDFSEYRGTLPKDIRFSDTREELLTKLGEPSWQRKSRKNNAVIADRWDSSENYIHITYDKESKLPSVVGVHIPDKE